MITYHTLNKGDTPSSLAKRFTGDASRYTDLLPCNKGLKQGTDGRTGAPAFHSCDWQAGTRISIPSSWTTEGTIGRVPVADNLRRRGVVGANDQDGEDATGTGTRDTSCSVEPLTEVKEYLYRWDGGDGMSQGATGFAKYWFAEAGAGTPTGVDIKSFQRANYEMVTVQKAWGCDFRNFPTGTCFKIPTSWPNPKADSKLIGKLREADCVKVYKGTTGTGGGGTGPGTQGTDGIAPVSLGEGDSTTTWLALLAVAGLATVGGVYLYKQRNKR